MKTITRVQRGLSILHRSAITVIDKLSIPTSPTGVDGGAATGSLAFSTAYNFTVAAGNLLGPTTVPTVGTVTTAADAVNTHSVIITIAQVANATVYDIFLSTAAAPLWVARITEAQRLAGVTVTAVGTVSATSPGAGKVQVNVIGTGVASTAAPFANSNAYTPELVTPIDCTGYANAVIQARVAVTDLRAAITFNMMVFAMSISSPTEWFPVVFTQTSTPLNAGRQPLAVSVVVPVQSTPAMVVLVDAITGQGSSASIWVDLV